MGKFISRYAETTFECEAGFGGNKIEQGPVQYKQCILLGALPDESSGRWMHSMLKLLQMRIQGK